jgi:hypothetical protein
MKLLALVTPTRFAIPEGRTCGALASRPTSRSGRPLEERKQIKVLSEVSSHAQARQLSRRTRNASEARANGFTTTYP